MTQKRLYLLSPLLFRRLAGSSANFCGQLFSAKILLFLMLQYRRNICKHSPSTSVKGVTCCRLESSDLFCATMEMFASIYHMHHSVHSQKPPSQRLRYKSTSGPKQNLSFLCWCHLQAKLGQIVTRKLPSGLTLILNLMNIFIHSTIHLSYLKVSDYFTEIMCLGLQMKTTQDHFYSADSLNSKPCYCNRHTCSFPWIRALIILGTILNKITHFLWSIGVIYSKARFIFWGNQFHGVAED